MKKTLLAAALVVGFAGAAQAETSVTLYGILDGGIGYQQVKGNANYSNNRNDTTDFKATRTGMVNGVQSGNRWGLKGTEDLGNGLQAIFQLESGFDLSTGKQGQNGRLFGRQATVGLQSASWGRLDLGRQTNIASKYLPGVADPFGASFGQANIGFAMSSANTHRIDNMIMYQTPNFSGFQFGIGYSFNADGSQEWKYSGTDDSNAHAITTGLRYANGPIGIALTYDQQKVSARGATGATFNTDRFVENWAATGVMPAPGSYYTGGTPGSDSYTKREWNIGGSYDFEVVKAYLAYGQTRNGLFAGGGFETPSLPSFASEGLKVNSYLVGLSAPIGNGTLMASWHMADPTSEPDSWDGKDWSMEKQQTYSLGYTYALSKRTNVYAIGSYAKHALFLPDAKATLAAVGIRHQF